MPISYGNSQGIKAMLSRCNIDFSIRQSMRIRIIDFYEVGIRHIAEGIQDTFYDILHSKSVKHSSQENVLAQVQDNYWRMILRIEDIRTLEDYTQQRQIVFDDLNAIQFEKDEIDKKSELFLELLCLAKKYKCEDDFIQFFKSFIGMERIRQTYLTCACSLVFFYNPHFYTYLGEKNILNAALKHLVDQRMYLASIGDDVREDSERKFIFKLLASNSMLMDYYLNKCV
jgi:hypothetical protein